MSFLKRAIQDGFRTAGRYPDNCHLYKMIDNTCCLASSEHAFEGGMDNLCLEFAIKEPDGGFDYIKTEPKQSAWKDLTSQLGDKKDLGDLNDNLKDLKKMFRK